MKINLYQNYYQDSNEERQKEIDYCLAINLKHPLLNVILIESQQRLTFNDFFNHAKQISQDDDINIIANSDIYMDDSIGLAIDLRLNQAYCLSRWDLLPDKSITHFAREDSQDVFIWRGKPHPNIKGDFYLGYLGCDNRICYELKQAGYNVYNPSRDIRTIHVHNSNIRNYVRKPEFTVPPPYLFCKPIHLKDIR